MPFASIADFLDMMPDTVQINAFVSRDRANNPTYAPTSTSYPAYIEMKNHLTVDAKGREVMARGKVFLGTATIIGIEDLLTLPAGFSPRTPPIIAVNVVSDEAGTHHTELEIG